MHAEHLAVTLWAISKCIGISGQMSTFQCISHVGSNPSLKQLMNGTTEPSWSVSALACAALCKKRFCISYFYDAITHKCLTQNVKTELSGSFCGIAVDQARLKCKVKGEAYIAFGGTFSSPMQCVCGTEKGPNNNWVPYRTNSYNCIETCTKPPCQFKLGFREPCVMCKGNETICNATYNPNVTVTICATIT